MLLHLFVDLFIARRACDAVAELLQAIMHLPDMPRRSIVATSEFQVRRPELGQVIPGLLDFPGPLDSVQSPSTAPPLNP